MRILHVTQNYYPSVGGSQYAIQKIAEYLYAAYNDEVTVVTTNSYFGPHRYNFKKIDVPEEILNGVTIKRFPFLRLHKKPIKLFTRFAGKFLHINFPDFFTNLQFGPVSISMRKAIINMPCDVICISSVHYSFASYPAWFKKDADKRPFVIFGALHLHNNEISNSYLKRIIAADYYIANTEYEKAYLISKKVAEEKIKVIGVATDILEKADLTRPMSVLREKYSVTPGKTIITFLGRHEISKGIPTLLKSFFHLATKHKNIQLIVAGARGGYTPSLEAEAANNDNILVQTSITDEQKADILRLTDVLVLPSVEESFGVVFLEAWAFEKPVIGANIGAIASLIKDGVDGLLFSPGDYINLATKMEALINNEDLRKELGQNGHKKFVANYTWDIVASRFRKVYELAINKHNKQI